MKRVYKHVLATLVVLVSSHANGAMDAPLEWGAKLDGQRALEATRSAVVAELEHNFADSPFPAATDLVLFGVDDVRPGHGIRVRSAGGLYTVCMGQAGRQGG